MKNKNKYISGEPRPRSKQKRFNIQNENPIRSFLCQTQQFVQQSELGRLSQHQNGVSYRTVRPFSNRQVLIQIL